jgi:hypothetical protein
MAAESKMSVKYFFFNLKFSKYQFFKKQVFVVFFTNHTNFMKQFFFKNFTMADKSKLRKIHSLLEHFYYISVLQ